MQVSLIIAFYKKTDFLHLILAALDTQSNKNFEVIIADDDHSETSAFFIKEQAAYHTYRLLHVNQMLDDGFRKNEVLNKAIVVAKGEIIVFIDGDCIPHIHFIKEYIGRMQDKTALFGRRVMLSQYLTMKLIQTHNLKLLSLFNLLITGSNQLKEALYLPFINKKRNAGIWGCNWGIYKKHLLEVNGFDEDYILAGVGEDVDIEARLKLNGIRLKSVKYKAIVYHLYHKLNYSDNDVQMNFKLLEQKQQEGLKYCRNGILKD
ncbi:MAG: glycosyltransferase [Bacteroidia bacterium]|nr:glycosyltransferase [Bacteroidia bacterium]